MNPKGHWPKGKRRNTPPKTTMATLNRIIRRLGSQRKAAAAIGVDWSTVGRWVRGTDNPSPTNAARILAAWRTLNPRT